MSRYSSYYSIGFKTYNGNDWIDFTDLPKYIYQGKEVIHWEACDGEDVKFKFRGLEGKLKIFFSRRKNKTTFVRVKYLTHSKVVNIALLRYISLGGIVGLVRKYNCEVGQVIKGMEILKLIEYQGTKGCLVKCQTTGIEFKILEANLLKNNQKSPYINSLYSIKWIHKYIKNKDDLLKYKKGSNKRIEFICPICNKTFIKPIASVVRHGFRCGKCDPRISFPERFMMAILDLNNIEYERQKVFSDFKKRRFDFYLPKYNWVIETHGKQHYTKKELFGSEKVFVSDKEKKDYCSSKNIKYIEVNCSYSDSKWIFKRLPKEILEMNSASLEQIQENTICSRMYDIKKDFDKGLDFNELEKKYGIKAKTIRVKLREVGVYKGRSFTTKVRCINNGEVFDSMISAAKYAGLKNQAGIGKCCKGEQKYAGKHPKNNEKLKWEFYKEEEAS